MPRGRLAPMGLERPETTRDTCRRLGTRGWDGRTKTPVYNQIQHGRAERAATRLYEGMTRRWRSFCPLGAAWVVPCG